jgi:hypothetical protein
MHTFNFEYTDTFGGQANYTWADRGIVIADTATEAAKKARAELGLTGVKGDIKFKTEDEIWWVPRGCCTILFITFNEGG